MYLKNIKSKNSFIKQSDQLMNLYQNIIYKIFWKENKSKILVCNGRGGLVMEYKCEEK